MEQHELIKLAIVMTLMLRLLVRASRGVRAPAAPSRSHFVRALGKRFHVLDDANFYAQLKALFTRLAKLETEMDEIKASRERIELEKGMRELKAWSDERDEFSAFLNEAEKRFKRILEEREKQLGLPVYSDSEKSSIESHSEDSSKMLSNKDA